MVTSASLASGRPRLVMEQATHLLGDWLRRGAEVVSFESEDPRFYLGRARRALDQGNLRAAMREAEKALRFDQESPWPLIVLARCAMAEGRFEDAVEVLIRAQRRAPRNGYVTSLLETALRRSRV